MNMNFLFSTKVIRTVFHYKLWLLVSFHYKLWLLVFFPYKLVSFHYKLWPLVSLLDKVGVLVLHGSPLLTDYHWCRHQHHHPNLSCTSSLVMITDISGIYRLHYATKGIFCLLFRCIGVPALKFGSWQE